MSLLRDLLDDATEWAEGRSWLVRLPLLAYLALVGWRHLKDPYYSSFLFGGVTFGVHELGHVIFMPLGEFMSFAGGSLAQILAPIAVGATLQLYRRDGDPQRDYFGAALALAWLAFALFDMATYVEDARLQTLPLLGLTSDPQHDWAYLLGRLGLLKQDLAIAKAIRVVATACWLAAMAFGGWLLLRMARSA